MNLLDPARSSDLPDEEFQRLVRATVEFFEAKGLRKLKEDDQAAVWYEDFLAFVKRERAFASLLTPAGYGAAASRWDMARIARYNEVLAFYGLCYWYAWQVTILGLGPIWMGENEDAKHTAARLLDEGGIFAFGLSERAHGADIYSTEMALHPQADGTFRARGSKYYIGNGNRAALVSVFGRVAGTDEYVFFAVRTDHPAYELKKKISTSGVRQAYVSALELHDYPITAADVLSRGKLAWDSALSTVNVGKFELGFASIGVCTHAFYEAIDHAAGRILYGRPVTDFEHVRRSFSDAWLRLTAMRLVAMRALDYFRAASAQDRRYLLFNPIVKMKVTSQGAQVITALHDVIAAKGYEQDTYFEMATRDIGMLPRLEGTEHVNMALIVKFTRAYFFAAREYPAVPIQDRPGNDAYLFHQATGGLADVTFPDYRHCYEGFGNPNVLLFRELVEAFRELLQHAPPSKEQQQDASYVLDAGQLFALVAYGQLLLEGSRLHAVSADVVDQLFELLVRDFAGFALHMVLAHPCTAEQESRFRGMLRKPVLDPARAQRIWSGCVLPLKGRYTMRP